MGRSGILACAIALALLWGCGGSEPPTAENPSATSSVHLTVSIPTRSSSPEVTRVVVLVTGDEIAGTLEFVLSYDPQTHLAAGNLQIPNGRTFFLIQALDASGEVVCEGRAGPINVDPVRNRPIVVELWSPETGMGAVQVCYSPFRSGQSPDTGIYPSKAEIRQDLLLLQPLVTAIRTYGVTKGLESIPSIAKELRIRCLAGAWVGRDSDSNRQEIETLITIAKAGMAQRVAVGNEVLLRGDLSKQELLTLIREVKRQVSVPVSTGEPYHIWLENPDLAQACDYLLVHIHPYWEGLPVEKALERVQAVYAQLKSAYPQKPIVLGECGWPSGGQAHGQAVPDPKNQRRFIRQLVGWAKASAVEVYLFEAFDEQWKTAHEGEVGAHWGLFQSDRTMKPEIRKIWF